MAEPMSIWSKTNVGEFHLHELKNRKLKDKKLKGIYDVIYLQKLTVSGEQLPIQKYFNNGFLPGSSILIAGYVPPNGDRFAVNLCNFEDDDDDIVLHFNPRFDQKEIVRNTCKDNDWGEEEVSGGFPLQAGDNFSLKIQCEEKKFEFYINEQLFGYYDHRMKPKKITHLELEGDVALNLILYKTIIEDEEDFDESSSESEEVSPTAPVGFEGGMSDVPSSIWAGNSETGIFPIYNPYHGSPDEFSKGIFIREMKTSDDEPMKVKFDKNFIPGSSIVVHGSVESDVERFELNLWSKKKINGDKKKDIAFHFNPRFDEREIVRNTFENDDWGVEERFGGFPITVENPFTIKINCEYDGFRVFVNDNEFTYYPHRMSPSDISKLEVEGAINVYSVFYKTS